MELVELPSKVHLEVDIMSSASGDKLAVCLHPWSWLGGQKDDPVLLSLVDDLEANDYHIVRYNSRGVGKSSGWPSFTGMAEVEDLQELVKWAIGKIPGILSVVLIGYSHGSLVASLHPVIAGIRTSHILISYPLGPRPWLTLFHTSTYAARLMQLVRDENAHVLVLYGDRDEFTSVESYRAWREQLEQEGGDRVRVVEVKGASHFWRGRAGGELGMEVAGWLP